MQELPQGMDRISQAAPPLTAEELERLASLPRQNLQGASAMPKDSITHEDLPDVYLKLKDPTKGLHPDNVLISMFGQDLPFVQAVSFDMNAHSPFASVSLTLFANLHVEK